MYVHISRRRFVGQITNKREREQGAVFAIFEREQFPNGSGCVKVFSLAIYRTMAISLWEMQHSEKRQKIGTHEKSISDIHIINNIWQNLHENFPM